MILSKYQYGKQLIKRHYTQGKRLTSKYNSLPVAFTSSLALEQLLANGQHHYLQKTCSLLIELGQDFAHYYLSKSYYLQYQLDAALKHIDSFLITKPHHEDALFLKAQILSEQGCAAQAKTLLHGMLSWSARGKTWQMLANLVKTTQDFQEFIQLASEFHTGVDNFSYDIMSHITHAAYASDNVDYALKLWRDRFQNQYQSSPDNQQRAKPRRVKYSQKHASIALKDLKKHLERQGISFFLISGTLLGCIRENQLLGHDKDVDVGVWRQDVCHTDLIKACRTSGVFYILPSSNQELVVVRHVNGTTIDIFIHHQNQDGVWHYGGKCKWHNSPFLLTKRAFLDDEHLIPLDHQTYLAENYGSDWQVPKIDFDSALDTPNMQITDPKKMLVYLCKRLLNPEKSISSNLNKRLIDNLNQLSIQLAIKE